MAPTQRFDREAWGTGPLTAPLSGRHAFLTNQGKQLMQAIRNGALQRAASLAQSLSLEIRDGYDPINKRALSAVQAAAQLEESLRRKDPGALRLSKNLQSEAIPLIRTLERMGKEMDEAIGQLAPCLARGEAEKAAALSRGIARTAKLFQDQNIERIRRLGPRMEELVAAVSTDPKEAALILTLTVQGREVLSLQEAAKANKVLSSGRQLLQALRQKSRVRAEKAWLEFNPAAEAFLEALKERAKHLSDLMKKHPDGCALFDAVRALGLPEEREQAFAEELLAHYRASRGEAGEIPRRLKELGKESAGRLDALQASLKKLKEEERLTAFLQDRIFRNTKVYGEMYEVLVRTPEAKEENGIMGLLKRGTDFFAG